MCHGISRVDMQETWPLAPLRAGTLEHDSDATEGLHYLGEESGLTHGIRIERRRSRCHSTSAEIPACETNQWHATCSFWVVGRVPLPCAALHLIRHARKERGMKRLLVLPLLGLFLAGASNALAQDVRYNFAKEANFAGFKTYKWVPIKTAQPLS